jgi:hypothetical protein
MGTLIALIVFAGIAIGVLALFRNLILWYFKIDEQIKILKKIEENTRKTT